jgi:hypothetical protein
LRSDAELYFAAVVGALAMLGYAWRTWREPRRRARRALAKLKETPIAEVKEGERVRITGVVAARGKTTSSPVGRRPCVGFRLVVEQRRKRWSEAFTEIARHETYREFSVVDDSGRVVVARPYLLGTAPDEQWVDLTPSFFKRLEGAGGDYWGMFARDRRAYVTETALEVGDRVSVVGRVSGGRLVGDELDPVMVADADELQRG